MKMNSELLNYIRTLLRIPDDQWNSDLIESIEKFFFTTEENLLIIFFDSQTSQWLTMNSVPLNFSFRHLYYFNRKTSQSIESIEEFLENIRCGYLNDRPIGCLTALLSGLVGPLLLENVTIQDMIKNDFASAMNQFLATFYEIQYRTEQSKTYLYIPKDSLNKSVDELIKDKAMITRLDAVVLKWHHQLKEILLIQNRLMSIDDQSAGIDEEIRFWEQRLTDLHSIRFQMERKEFQTIINVLTRSKSAYLHQFIQVQREIQEFTIYVDDCLKFLKILAEPSSQLDEISIDQFHRLITEIFYRILVTWHHSIFFASLDRMKLIISKINNQIINRCVRSLNIKRLFQGFVESTQKTLHQSFEIIDIYLERCFHIVKMHDQHSTKPLIDSNSSVDELFHSVHLFRQRLIEIDEICESMKLFGSYRDGNRATLPFFAGIQGDEYRHMFDECRQAFDRALIILKQQAKMILDVSISTHTKWSIELKKFFQSIHEIELIIVKLINESLSKATTIEQTMDILDIFFDFHQRSTINHVLNEKIHDVLRFFLNEIEEIRTEIVAHQNLDETKGFFDRLLPHYPSKVMWIRQLIERLKRDYHRLLVSSDFFDSNQKFEMKSTFEKLVQLAENLQQRIYHDWWTIVNELQPKKLLEKPFLKENEEKKHLIDVFFDPQILIALNESLWWVRMNFEIPFSLNDVYNTRKTFRQMREEATGFIRKFNKAIQSLNSDEENLFEERIRTIWKKLQPGFLGRVTCVDPNVFQEFTAEATRTIDEFVEMITIFKDLYVQCCTDCVAISQQLFVKIDQGLIFTFPTLKNTLTSVDRVSQYLIHLKYEDMAIGIRKQQMIFKDDPDKILQYWDHWLSSIDCMFEKSLLLNANHSLAQLSSIVNGDTQLAATPFLSIELLLDRIDSSSRYILRFEPTLDDISTTLNSVGQIQLIETIKHFVRLCDLFSYHPFHRETYASIIDHHPLKQKLQNRITVGLQQCITEVNQYVETTWSRFRQLWEVDQESFIAVYELENTDLQGLEADIARYTELANNINSQENLVNVRILQIDSSALKVSLVQICQQWQQNLIYIVLRRLEKDLEMISMLMKENIEKLNILPKTYDEIPIYQQMIDNLKLDLPQIDSKFPVINEEVALLLRYEIDIDPQISEKHRLLARQWENYKTLLDESIASFKRLKEQFKVQLQKEQEKSLQEIGALQKSFHLTGPHQADIPISVALDQCEQIEKHIEMIELDEQRMKKAYRIFQLDMSLSKDLPSLKKDIEVLKSIWLLAKEFDDTLNRWKSTSFDQLKIDQFDDFAQIQAKKLARLSRDHKDKNWSILRALRERIETFRRLIPLIESLHNPHLRPRHWEQIKRQTDKYFQHDSTDFTFEKLLDLHFEENIPIITDISENASKEFTIEQILEKIVETWNELKFDTTLHKTNTYKLKSADEIIFYVEEHTAQISTIKGTRHMKPFEREIDYWEASIGQISEVCEGLFNVQRQWLYMEGIFTSDDVQRQLAYEAAEFKVINTIWQDEILGKIREEPNALIVATKLNLMEKIQNLLKSLEIIQKKMEDYLETKRTIFPRFYFISNEELVEILSLSRQPDLVQTHLKKLFDNIRSLRLVSKKTILASGIISQEEEELSLVSSLVLEGNVELWLKELETKMRITVREYLKNTLVALRSQSTKREKWLKDWPSQCCVTASEIEWTTLTSKAIVNCQADGNLKPLKKLFRTQMKILDRYSTLIRQSLERILRLRVVGVITKDVHGRDILERLIKSQTMDLQAFEWQMQLRFYWERIEQQEDCFIRQTITKFKYNYEYLGCTSRLVISPLTDRCYITLTTALHLFRGGSANGPAGTGKTETIKDLGKNFAMYVVVQNCSEALDYKSMGKMFSGFAQSGSWGCFDEFNRINIEVLSVVAQQIHAILTALSLKQKRFIFEAKEIPILPQVAIFITMNPGYAGRTELPDNLKSMFRPVSMVVPDSVYIAENFLFSEGFQKTRLLARKVYTLYQLSSQQLSKQDHYDFGLRSLTAVLRYAGEKRRKNPTMTDDEVLLLSMLDMNAPKMTAHDGPLFRSLVEDLFPGISIPQIDYSKLIAAIENEMVVHHLQSRPISVQKVIELYETHHSRHSVMLVGKTLSGKSTTWKLLKNACTSLSKQGSTDYQKIQEYPINPKAVTLGELYGQFNLATNEWSDGILSSIMRQVCADEKPDEKFVLFDAPVDTSWIESMNSLMDDNKLLTLANGERISMPTQVTLLFETEDLSTASPATVSRAGIVYCDYEQLHWRPYFDSWLKQKSSTDLQNDVENCVTKYLETILNYKRLHCHELIPIHELNGIISLTRLFDTFWSSEIIQQQLNESETLAGRLIEMIFVFSLIWSVGASVDDDGRKKIDLIFREIEGTFPNKDTVFEFYVDINNRTWLHWEEHLKAGWKYDPEIPFYKMIVPTVDTVRYEYLIRHLLLCKYPILLIGAVGTGKTTVAEQVLDQFDLDVYNTLIVHMSAQTTSKMLQEIFESNLEKRAKNIYVPLNGKKLITFIDDLNMPAKDAYGFQPALELIRTWIDYEFWYDRKTQGMKYVKDMSLVTAMGPPGGGRQQISRRLQTRFNLINMTFPSDHEISRIFGSMLNEKFATFDDEIKYLLPNLTKATVDLYQSIEQRYLPTPTKIHYTFNMRDISRMFEGLLQSDKQVITNKVELLRLWLHEAHRVYSDRFLTNEDHEFFVKILDEKLALYFDQVYHNVCYNREAPIYSDILRTDGIYEEIRDYEKLKTFLEEILQKYNKTPLMITMDLVMFRDAVLNICRIVRILRRPRGNLLLLGIGGSGRQSLARLSAFLCEISIFHIEIGRRYGHTEFKEDIRRLMKLCGISNREVLFLFFDTQIIDSVFLEDINAILHTGEVPNLFRSEDFQEIRNQLSPILARQGLPDSHRNLMQLFFQHVQTNLHLAICMSPMNEMFRNYIRMYPALVNCSTVIYFSEWPHEALIAVAQHFLVKFSQVESSIHRTLANLCAFIHLSTKTFANRMKDELRREIHITPMNYLQFVRNYNGLFENEKAKLQKEYNRLQMGIVKVAETRAKVGEISVELEKKKILVGQLQRECEEFLGKIVEEKTSASERERQVQAFGIRIGEEEIRCQTIAAAAHEELAEAEPMLLKANEALEQLTKRDIGEVKAYVHPPSAVEKVMKALMILKGKEDTWEEAKKDLANVDFIKTLTKFPKDEITDRTLRRMQPFINDSELIPEKLKAVSSAASALCTWVRAVESYARVYRIVQPKKERYQRAMADLIEKQQLLQESKNELAEIQTRIERLRMDYEMKMREKDTLQRNAEETAMFLDRATKLLDGVAEKRTIWDSTSKDLLNNLDHLLGNSLLASAFLSYLGPFLSNYRDEIVHQVWEKEMIRNEIHFTSDFNFAQFLSTPTIVRQWNIQGLPRDHFSTENAILATRAFSTPLFIDPQSQATQWIKQMEKSHGLKIIDLQMRDYMKIIEECLKLGRPCLCRNVLDDLPEILNPILIKSIKTNVERPSELLLQIGDRLVEYHRSFRFYLSTRLSNPKYKPEIYSKVTMINFAIKEQGLEEQLLGIVVRKEKADLENSKDNCIVTIARKHAEKEMLEEEFLRLLSETEGSLLENVKVFQALDLSKQSQKDIEETLKINENLEIQIDRTRENYRVVAQRAALLFFVLQDFSSIDSMYQFSLDSYIQLFLLSIEKSPKSIKLNERIEKLNDFHTYAVYKYGCRALFERHKLIFSFHICTKILDSENRLNHDEYQFLVRAHTLVIDRENQYPNPFAQWLDEQRWDQMSELIRMTDYRFLRDSFDQFSKDWKEWYLSEEAEKTSLPGTIDSLINEFGRLLIIRCFRPDRLTHSISQFISQNLGSKYLEPPILQLHSIVEDSNKRSPLIFILSPGVDPAAKLQQLAEEKQMNTGRYFALSLGQGQAATARKLLEIGMKKGHWIYLANCHLAISWLAELDKIVEQLQTAVVHHDFRLWLSSAPIDQFPVSILQLSLKITNEPQKGIKANMKRLYELITAEQFQRGEKYRKLIFALTFFHSILIERKKFRQLGWNINYTFNDSDFQISENLLAIYLDLYDKTPFNALKYLISVVIYGGHCTDKWDMRLLQTYIDSYIRDEVIDVMYYKLSSLPYYYLPRDGPLKSYKDFINSMPTNDHPEAFGQHSNADVASQIHESKNFAQTLLALLPQKHSSTDEKQIENEVKNIVKDMLKSMPKLIDVELMNKYLMLNVSPISIVLLQEVERYNILLVQMIEVLNDLIKSIDGFVVMSIELENLFENISHGRIPNDWQRIYKTSKSLSSWFDDLRRRFEFFRSWVENQNEPTIYWISAFAYPTAFLTAVLQRSARRHQIGIDQLSWDFDVNKGDEKTRNDLDDAVAINGLYLEGASWDRQQGILIESKSMELLTLMPTMYFKVVEQKKKNVKGVYIAPCYYSSSRVGSFILAVELKTGSLSIEHWIKRATALLMNVDQ